MNNAERLERIQKINQEMEKMEIRARLLLEEAEFLRADADR